jgi:hypothetical protein
MTTRAHDDLLVLATLQRERDDLREANAQARRHVQRVIDAANFGDENRATIREMHGAAEDALRWLEDAPAGAKEKCMHEVRRPSGWLVSGTCFGWFGATTYAITAWGGMPWPGVAFWIYSAAMLGALLLGSWLGWREGRAG